VKGGMLPYTQLAGAAGALICASDAAFALRR